MPNTKTFYNLVVIGGLATTEVIKRYTFSLDYVILIFNININININILYFTIIYKVNFEYITLISLQVNLLVFILLLNLICSV